ncbi:SDR family oxidoreductase [Streptomyces sp. HNM0575]|uniref:SDR family oxidoreductase n=1 Tax=Streptomyces sp. HNM0575 TaxID=2716338 RepID=UPI00145EF42D|nr:SDR family NAD(P)-dependent oxidoreductase [Streptomyces sp. HNM0575]NLU73997.1 SDR family oxidoreductase [Streptomyces sp. HNM0575]
MSRYTGRVVMISGAGQGLGRAMAERFAADGAAVAVGDVRGPAAGETAALCGVPLARPSTVDVTDAGQVDRWVADTVDAFGRVDVLVNNAGVLRDNRLEHMTGEEWDTAVDVSLRGAFHCTRAVFALMKAQRYGRVLSLSSVCWRGNFGQANYAAAKAGIVGLARTVALEGAAHGVTSNVISPGIIETPMLAALPRRARERLSRSVPVRRAGHPAEIADAAAFLCDEQAAYITGAVLDVDGGFSVGSALR